MIHHCTEYPTVCYSRPSRETRWAILVYPIRDASIPGPFNCFYNLWSSTDYVEDLSQRHCYTTLPRVRRCGVQLPRRVRGILLARDATSYLLNINLSVPRAHCNPDVLIIDIHY